MIVPPAHVIYPKSPIMVGKVIFLTSTGAGQWQVPNDWNDADNDIHCIAAGGGGNNSAANGVDGGGGGAYASVSNISLTPGAMIDYHVGPGTGGTGSGGHTWFNGTSLSNCSVGADSGNGGSQNRAGGSASASVGTIRFSGGSGGFGFSGSGGGGGAAGGPNGNGGNGQSGASGSRGGATAGGISGGFPGGPKAGNMEVSWLATGGGDETAGPGSGGAGGGQGPPGGNGGFYGGGGGGGGASQGGGGAGRQGIIVIRYVPLKE